MRIGILTFHCAHNYGAVIQCLALKEYLTHIGHDVHVIDYRPDYLTRHRDYIKFSFSLCLTKNIKLLPAVAVNAIRTAFSRNRKWHKFERFIQNNLNLIALHGNECKTLDLCIVGSDQIWNRKATGGSFDPIYFGIGQNSPVISYGASTIVDSYNDEEKITLRQYLNNLDAISVRELHLGKLIKDVAGINYTLVVDPTFLIGQDIYQKYFKQEYILKTVGNSEYVLVYTIYDDPKLIEFAQRIADEKGMKCVNVASNFPFTKKIDKVFDASPEEFLTLIGNAKYVITNSFHGTALSIIMHRDFYTIKQNNGVDERMAQILNAIGLNDRFISLDKSAPMEIESINYSSIDSCLSKLIDSSQAFLKANLQK